MTLLRADRGFCCRCGLPSDGYVALGDDGKQRLLCVPCVTELEPGRQVPEPFGRRVLPSPADGWCPPPLPGTPAESWETALVVGFRGSIGGTIAREE